MAKNAFSRGWLDLSITFFFLALSGLAINQMRLGKAPTAVGEHLEAGANSLTIPGKEYRLREHYTGIAPLDIGFRFLVLAFLPGVAGWDKNIQIQQFYFLVSFFPIIAIWAAEAGRKGNKWSLISWTSIWALFYQTVGGAIIIPLYYLAYVRGCSKKKFWSPESRPMKVSYAKALLPSLLLGYLLPTIAMYLPFPDSDMYVTQGLIALWQLTPLIVDILLFILPKFYGDEPRESTTLADVRYLNRFYLVCFVVSAVAHLGTILICVSSSQISIADALILVRLSDRYDMAECLHYIFQIDFWIIFAAAAANAYVSLWDLKRVGKTDLSLFQAAIGMAVGIICVGPGAIVAGVWYMRERIMTRKEKQ